VGDEFVHAIGQANEGDEDKRRFSRLSTRTWKRKLSNHKRCLQDQEKL